MKAQSAFILTAFLALLWTFGAAAQMPDPRPGTGDMQRNALNAMRSQMNFFQNATRTAPSYGDQGYGNVWSQFQALRGAYNDLKQTLTPQQLTKGANALAELDAGLDILQEAFANYQNDVASGRRPYSALTDMCQVLRQGSQLWLQQLNKTSSQLRIGFG